MGNQTGFKGGLYSLGGDENGLYVPPQILEEKNIERNIKEAERIQETIDIYNLSVFDMYPELAKLQMKNNLLLVQMFRLDSFKNGLSIPNHIELTLKSGQPGTQKDSVPDPFPFSYIGVVKVNVEGYNAGDLVMLNPDVVKTIQNPSTTRLEWINMFHPNYIGVVKIRNYEVIATIPKENIKDFLDVSAYNS